MFMKLVHRPLDKSGVSAVTRNPIKGRISGCSH
jgi:hypothetical protein